VACFTNTRERRERGDSEGCDRTPCGSRSSQKLPPAESLPLDVLLPESMLLKLL